MAWQVRASARIYVLVGSCLFVLAAGVWQWAGVKQAPLLLVPMMSLAPCLLAQSGEVSDAQPDWYSRCTGPNASASHLVESTLRDLQPAGLDDVAWKLGYTLQVPLLALLQPDKGTWHVNQQAIANIGRTVLDTQRPLVLYLFSTHFSVNAPIEPLLAADAGNLAQTPQGPLPIDHYYGMPIYPWSVARTDNPITKYRVQVIEALLKNLCQLPAVARERIRGITLLGEVHQLFPNFESGMGFGGAYEVSDYSPTSIAGFRHFLQLRYADIDKLNGRMGSDYPSFESVNPPGKNIRTEPLRRYQEHIDSYAAGNIPITGWVYAPDAQGAKQVVNVYLDGKRVGEAPVRLSRQDVRVARPEFNTAEVGWRYDLDYRRISPGIHRVDLALVQSAGTLIHLGSRSISIMDPRQDTPAAAPVVALPPMLPLASHIATYIDEPRDLASFYYNPLASDWQAFRETQVAEYLQYFNTVMDRSCLAGTRRYTHQIVPQFNPGWDSGKFAVDASLQPTNSLHTGISLYGEASFGSSVTEWLLDSRINDYGVTEFHPLKDMNGRELAEVLSLHRRHGARFLSFFLETRWRNRRISDPPNLFSFDPDNQQYASDRLYASVKTLLAH